MRHPTPDDRMRSAFLEQYRGEESALLQQIVADASYPYSARRAAHHVLAERGELGAGGLPLWDPASDRAPSAVRLGVGAVLVLVVALAGAWWSRPSGPQEGEACAALLQALSRTDAHFALQLETRSCRPCLADECAAPRPEAVTLLVSLCATLSASSPVAWRRALHAQRPGEACAELPLGELVEREGRPWFVALRLPG